MKTIIELLKEADCEYRVHTAQVESYELYFVHERAETVRSTTSTTRTITVYADHDGFKGDSTFHVSPSDSEEQIKSKIESAKAQAALICNEMYALPAAESEERTIPSNLADPPMPELAARVAKACFAADMCGDGSINALEIFLYREKTSVENSNGLNKCEHKCRAMIEAIPTWNENGESVELYEQYHFTDLDEEAITAEITEKMREVRDRYHAKKPQKTISAPIVLRTPEIAELCNDIAAMLNYSAVYGKTNLYKKGDDVQKCAGGDPVTIERKAGVPGSRFSAAFDSDGCALHDRVLVKDGVAEGYYGSNRFAQYLGEQCSGDLPCTELAKGTLTESELSGMRYLECASLSGLQVDLYNDYIGGEVRLAYLVENGKRTPVTGISVSGKLSEVLPEVRLSENVKTHSNYRGPDKMLLKNMTIL